MKYNRKEKQEMRVEIDTHTHTLASGHAYNTLNEMAQAAAVGPPSRQPPARSGTRDARNLSFVLFSKFKNCSKKKIRD